MNPTRDPIHLLDAKLKAMRLTLDQLAALLPKLDAVCSGEQAVQAFDQVQRADWMLTSALDLGQRVAAQRRET